MGWSLTRNKPSHMSALEFLTSPLCGALDYSPMPEEQRPTIVAKGQGAQACYFAMRCPAAYVAAHDWAMKYYVPDLDGTITLATIILFKDYDRGQEFGWKSMGESSGVGVCDCPASVLSKLSALVPGELTDCAAEWRAACTNEREKRRKHAGLKDGQRVTLASPLRFSDGKSCAEFTVAHMRTRRGAKTLCFRSDAGGHYRITAKQLEGATIQ